jgi:hypothetical protein
MYFTVLSTPVDFIHSFDSGPESLKIYRGAKRGLDDRQNPWTEGGKEKEMRIGFNRQNLLPQEANLLDAWGKAYVYP